MYIRRNLSIAIVLLSLAASNNAAVLGNHLDGSFSTDGKITRRVPGNLNGATDVAVQTDGKIVAVGNAWSPQRDFLVVRYNSDGTIDSRKSDVTVFRPSNGVWYVQKGTGGYNVVGFGTNGDIPLSSAYWPR